MYEYYIILLHSDSSNTYSMMLKHILKSQESHMFAEKTNENAHELLVFLKKKKYVIFLLREHLRSYKSD